MPKTKISEYSTTNSNNTDIESINIDEGCAPSGINNAIRELMVHLKEFQTGSSGDPLTVAGGFVASGGFTSNTMTVTGILTASGGTILSSTNTLSGSNIISGNINSSGSANTFSGGVVHSGTNTFSSSLIISGNINSSGTTNTFSGGNILSGTNTFSGTNIFSSDVTLNAQSDLRFADSDSSNWVAFQSPATVASNVTWTLPATDGTSNQALVTNGSGTLSWATASASPGGSTTQLQYNNAGAFGGISGVTSDGTRITASTTIGVGGATPSTSGSGITFPATASASSDANTLDDYEEGTWTPAYSSGSSTWVYTVQAGRYIKVGNCVTHTFYIAATATIVSTNAQAAITGLPFTGVGINSDGRTSGSCKFGPNFGTHQIAPTGSAVTWLQTDGTGDGNGWGNTTNWPAATSVLHFGTFVTILT
jgi:hypothetical protein